MSLQYSGGTIINRVQALTTRQDHANFITQALLDAGWTTISGTPGNVGTIAVIQESAAGNQGQKIRVRSIDPNTGNSPQYTITHVSGSPTSQAVFANPAFTWRVVATKFHFFSFVTGVTTRLTSRCFVSGGLLYAPTFLPFSAGDALGFIYSNGVSDTDNANVRSCWRTTLRQYDGTNNNGLFSGIIYTTNRDFNNWGTTIGNPSIAVWQGGYSGAGNDSYRWTDGTLPAYEPLVIWSSLGATFEGKYQGQLYDAMIMNESFTSETAITYDGHTWIAVTDNAGLVALAARATLFIAVT